MLVAFLKDHAGKLTGQKADMDANVALGLIRLKIVKRIDSKVPEKKLVPSSNPEPKKPGRPAKK